MNRLFLIFFARAGNKCGKLLKCITCRLKVEEISFSSFICSNGWLLGFGNMIFSLGKCIVTVLENKGVWRQEDALLKKGKTESKGLCQNIRRNFCVIQKVTTFSRVKGQNIVKRRFQCVSKNKNNFIFYKKPQVIVS